MLPEVNAYLQNLTQWRAESDLLRHLCLDAGLEEAWKWKQPCYTHTGGNVAILGGFNDYVCLSFFKGALLKDPDGLLVFPGPNTRSAKLLKFTSVDGITELAPTIAAYLQEAKALEAAGKQVDFTENRALDLPQELHVAFANDPAFAAAFAALTPGRQRGYLIHFNGAKQSATRANRIAKYKAKILAGKGMQDWK